MPAILRRSVSVTDPSRSSGYSVRSRSGVLQVSGIFLSSHRHSASIDSLPGLPGAEPAVNKERTDVRFICNPNNPTGTLLRQAELLNILDSVKHNNGILFCDEAFIGLADGKESLVDIRDPHLFVLHSLTKSFAVPGLRIGFGFGDRDLVEKIETARSPWCVNAYAEAFAMEALLHLGELADSRKAIAKERDRLVSAISSLDLHCYPSSVNYVLVECSREVSPLCEALARKNILVRELYFIRTPDLHPDRCEDPR